MGHSNNTEIHKKQRQAERTFGNKDFLLQGIQRWLKHKTHNKLNLSMKTASFRTPIYTH